MLETTSSWNYDKGKTVENSNLLYEIIMCRPYVGWTAIYNKQT